MKSVRYETFWHSPMDGWAIAARNYALAMHWAGIDVHLHSWVQFSHVPDAVFEEMEVLFGKPVVPCDTYVFCTALGSPKRAQEVLGSLSETPFKTKVFYTTLERTHVPRETVEQLKKMTGVWVPCWANHEVLKEQAPDLNVAVLPHPYFDHHPNLMLDASSKADTFGWVGRWEPRKAPDNLIRAFMRAFRPGEAKLKLKLSPTGGTRWKGLPHTPEATLLDECRKNPHWSARDLKQNIEVIHDSFTPEQMTDFYQSIDVYASASRGEGWDLPCFEAKLAGRRVVTVNSGGPADFVTENDILIPVNGEVPAEDYFELWGEGSAFLSYNFELLVEALKEAKQNPKLGERPSDLFRADNVGRSIREWLESLS